MSKRNEIRNFIKSKLETLNDTVYLDFKTPDMISNFPAYSVTIGDELVSLGQTFYECTLELIVTINVKDNSDPVSVLNDKIEAIYKLFYPYVIGCQSPGIDNLLWLRIARTTTDERWLSPFAVARIYFLARYRIYQEA